jgi:putative tryptophan/tyrosine transport system substrate-binding protein
MRRRDFIKGIAGSIAVSSPLVVRAQVPRGQKIANVGMLNYAAANDALVEEFRRALRQLGYVEGQTITTTYRWADGNFDRLPALAEELVAQKVDVIIALGPAVWAAKRTTTTIPIVIAFSGDPVGDQVVPNLARPGGNITGFSYMSTDLAAKRLELLSQSFPNGRAAILYNPDEPATRLELKATETAAQALGVKLLPLTARRSEDIAQVFAQASGERVAGVIVFTHGFAVLNRERIIEMAARERLPTVYGWRDFVTAGGLMSYGPNIQIIVRKAAVYVDRIIKGEQAGSLPVEQPARLELALNLGTARALGISIPPALLARADEVIE